MEKSNIIIVDDTKEILSSFRNWPSIADVNALELEPIAYNVLASAEILLS